MKLIDEKGRIGGKFSIIDLLVILLIIACVFAVVIKMQTTEDVRGGDRTITCEVRVEYIRDITVNAIKSVSEVIDAETEKELGEILDITTTPARLIMQVNDGSYTFVEYQDRYDAIVTIEAEGTETNDGYYTTSGRQLMVGETIGISNGNVQFFGEIISVKAE
ncbi:MAG: DUF4330 domain-containing protein [Clostridia bacterium]|nr:DUF4330 domain-containing protein [Clostridia bacterium]